MPKAKRNIGTKIRDWLKEVNNKDLTFDGENVHCSVCSKKKYFCSQHRFGFIFDIDGVLIRGKNVLPSVPESFRNLIKSNHEFRIPTVFVTNSGNTLRKEKADDLTRLLEIPINENQVVLSYSPLCTLKEYYNKRLLFTGQGEVEKIASELGFKNIITMEELVRNFPSLDYVDKKKRIPINGPRDETFKKIEGIILLNEPTNWETSLQLIIDLLLTNGMPVQITHFSYPHIPLMACNMDLLWVSEAPLPRFGHGTFLLCLESLFKKITGKNLIYTAMIGKPSLKTYCYAHELLIEHAKSIGINNGIEKIYAIGDNINTDIYGANLYNKYLTIGGSSLDSENEKPIKTSQNNLHNPSTKSCISILVKTGVHSSMSDFNARHSHRDFSSTNDKLWKPAVIVDDVKSAIDYVLQKEQV